MLNNQVSLEQFRNYFNLFFGTFLGAWLGSSEALWSSPPSKSITLIVCVLAFPVVLLIVSDPSRHIRERILGAFLCAILSVCISIVYSPLVWSLFTSSASTSFVALIVMWIMILFFSRSIVRFLTERRE